MAKPSKYSRARIRSRVRRPKKRGGSRAWFLATAAVVVVGVLLVILSYSDRQDSAAVSPKIGDHWHAYLGVNVCGEWLSNAPQFESGFGIHSHGDGLMHIHPFTNAASGTKATVGRFLEDNEGAGWSATASSLKLWDNATHTNGDRCGTGADAKPAEVQWKVGKHNEPWPTKARTGNPADYRPQNGDIVAIYFLPKGAPLDQPPSANTALDNIQDLGGQPATSQTTVAGSTQTTVATNPATTSSSTP
jgi:hypothetical protein